MKKRALRVECFKTDSGSFMKYGYIVMRKPTAMLCRSKGYLKWFQELRKCASDADLLEQFNGIARSKSQGEEQDEFDKKRAALNRFIFETIGEDYRRGYSSGEWQDDLRNSPNFDQIATSTILQRVKHNAIDDELLREFATKYKQNYNCEEAISHLNAEWDNLKLIRTTTPDYFYHFGAWNLANEYNLTEVRQFYAKSLPKMPSIEEVKQALQDSCPR